jgi:DNA modification methylase|tara:strand:+ start:73 stop:1221 length:1149 start_codon:yes stop_codon:yes gene_type:complete
MKIEMINIDNVKPYENNPRNNAISIDKVADSIREFGFRQPIVVDEDMTILAGHTRLLASKQLELKEVPIHIADGLTNSQKKAYRIMDNKSAEDSEWDMNLLNLEMKDLMDDGYNLNLTGFTPEQLEALSVLTESTLEGETDEDDLPKIPKEPKSKLGEIYELGHHRLMCGDSTSIDAVDKLMDGKDASMLFTDPPYNVAFNGRSGDFDVIKNDDLSENEFNDFINSFLSIVSILNITNYYICCNWAFYGLLQLKLKPKACIVWAKNVFGLGVGYRHQHEFILFNGNIKKSIKNESDLWNIARDTNYKHPTQKPVALAQRAIENTTSKGNLVLDLFGGSGSTLIAAEKSARKCYMMELDPIYIDVIIQRWENFTGKQAKLTNG